MIDDTKNRQEQELSMDEILSSIRNIITEDQESTNEVRRIFPHDSTTNPSGARMIEDLPKFEEDYFELPNFKAEELEERRAEERELKKQSVFPDEAFEVKFSNERSFKESSDSFYQRDFYARDANAEEDRISKALKGIVDSYVQRNTHEKVVREHPVRHEVEYTTDRLTATINTMLERKVLTHIEEWLERQLPEIVEKAIIRELERVMSRMKF
jgi:cell pole-organizing protein PopZ